MRGDIPEHGLMALTWYAAANDFFFCRQLSQESDSRRRREPDAENRRMQGRHGYQLDTRVFGAMRPEEAGFSFFDAEVLAQQPARLFEDSMRFVPYLPAIFYASSSFIGSKGSSMMRTGRPMGVEYTLLKSIPSFA